LFSAEELVITEEDLQEAIKQLETVCKMTFQMSLAYRSSIATDE
jgi:hypothetical protein